MLHQSITSQSIKKDDLRQQKDSFETATYDVTIVATMVEEATNDACAPSIIT